MLVFGWDACWLSTQRSAACASSVHAWAAWPTQRGPWLPGNTARQACGSRQPVSRRAGSCCPGSPRALTSGGHALVCLRTLLPGQPWLLCSAIAHSSLAHGELVAARAGGVARAHDPGTCKCQAGKSCTALQGHGPMPGRLAGGRFLGAAQYFRTQQQVCPISTPHDQGTD